MQREEMPVNVLFVGGGPANLAGAIRLMDLITGHNEAIEAGSKQGEAIQEPTIALLEKGSGIGSHQLSGAVLDPLALDELIPDWQAQGAPLKLGVPTAMTGTWAALGAQVVRSCRLWAKTINAEGGLLGRPVEFLFEDTQGVPANCLRKAQEMV